MGNDQLLPAYNVQVGVADGYIAVVDVNQYRSDMDCFIPLMNKFHDIYGFYPKYPVADAGYGSYNNYIFCEQNGLEKYMKFPMFKKETTDRNYHEAHSGQLISRSTEMEKCGALTERDSICSTVRQ